MAPLLVNEVSYNSLYSRFSMEIQILLMCILLLENKGEKLKMCPNQFQNIGESGEGISVAGKSGERNPHSIYGACF